MIKIYHPIFRKHNQDSDYPENPGRIELIIEELERDQASDPAIVRAKKGETFLQLAHTPEYIQKVRDASEKEDFLDKETQLDSDSYTVAAYAVGASIRAVKSALSGKNAFAVIRPPGHHAHADWSYGFCIFNNMAIAAVYATKKEKKVAVLDIDAHDGDGTADITSEYPGILYVSSHQQGVFPYEASYESDHDEILKRGTSGIEYLKNHWTRMLARVLRFNPDIIGLSLGTDAHKDDNLEGKIRGVRLGFTNETYRAVKKDLDALNKPYFVLLEGGYNPEVVYDVFHIFTDD
jgi:acetoin utilization deacetylase AcuC-like enzyme